MSDKVTDFLKDLASDKAKLGEFIHDPDKALAGFSDEEKHQIKAVVAHEVHTKMSEHCKQGPKFILM